VITLAKYGPILIILSPLHSAMNAKRSFYIICHLTSNRLPHYIVKFGCSTFTIVIFIQFKSVQSCLFSVNIYIQGCHDIDDMSLPIHLQCYIMCSKYPPSARSHASSRARHLSMDASMTRCSIHELSKAFNRRCRNLLR